MNKVVPSKSNVRVMGVLNVTPDSFSDGGKFSAIDQAISHAMQMIEEGADIIDIGGESSRPNAQPLPLEEELNRVIPVIKQLRALTDIPISIDTYKPEVMQQACDAGASIINDIKALREPGALETAKVCGVPVVLMHMQNNPQNMQLAPYYENVVQEVNDFFSERIEACLEVGIKKENIILDPGFGFGKNVQHNCQLLQNLKVIKEKWQLPLLVGLSRKSMIKDLLDLPVEERLYPSVALAVYAVLQGADIVRVHDVLATRRAVDTINKLEYFSFPSPLREGGR